MFMQTAAKQPAGSATVCQAGRALAVTSRVQTVCGVVTVTRPVSSTVQTATRVSGKQEHACAVQVTGESPVKTSAALVCSESSAACRAHPVASRTAAIM